MDWTAIAVAIVGSGGLGAVLATFFQRSRYAAEARKLEMEASQTVITGLEKHVDWQKGQIERYQTEVGKLREKVSCLEKQGAEDRILIRGLSGQVKELQEKMKVINGECDEGE